MVVVRVCIWERSQHKSTTLLFFPHVAAVAHPAGSRGALLRTQAINDTVRLGTIAPPKEIKKKTNFYKRHKLLSRYNHEGSAPLGGAGGPGTNSSKVSSRPDHGAGSTNLRMSLSAPMMGPKFDSKKQKFVLICGKCFAHNGLMPEVVWGEACECFSILYHYDDDETVVFFAKEEGWGRGGGERGECMCMVGERNFEVCMICMHKLVLYAGVAGRDESGGAAAGARGAAGAVGPAQCNGGREVWGPLVPIYSHGLGVPAIGWLMTGTAMVRRWAAGSTKKPGMGHAKPTMMASYYETLTHEWERALPSVAAAQLWLARLSF
ncbi:hypothetical protein K438DRAFT_1762311 [Mycena galopus ATCC 62051]|nr:hypothetical protein K438DRAFT_1762311 [Mycena galopus ATCC 62051]